ncbi:sigma-70 family RNA polymerase sigma factor, partial [Anaerovorax odorimutans]
LKPPDNVEDTVLTNLYNQQLRQTIAELPKTQRKRFVSFYLQGLTEAEIAKIEGCTQQAVAKSIKAARKNILKKLKK